MTTATAHSAVAAARVPAVVNGVVSTDLSPTAIWVGCLACYSEGRLVGEWIEATDPEAEDYRPCNRPGHDEFEVLDTNHSAVRAEAGVAAAIADAAALEAIGEAAEAAGVSVGIILAWLADRGESVANWEAVAADWEDAAPYVADGAWTDDAAVEEWAHEFLTDSGMLAELPEWAQAYSGALAESFGRDVRLGGEVTVLRADDFTGRVVVRAL